MLLFKEHERLGLLSTASRHGFWRSRYCVTSKEARRGFGQGRRISQKGLENVKRELLIDGVIFYNRFKARIRLLKYVDELKFARKPIIRRQLGLVFFMPGYCAPPCARSQEKTAFGSLYRVRVRVCKSVSIFIIQISRCRRRRRRTVTSPWRRRQRPPISMVLARKLFPRNTLRRPARDDGKKGCAQWEMGDKDRGGKGIKTYFAKSIFTRRRPIRTSDDNAPSKDLRRSVDTDRTQ